MISNCYFMLPIIFFIAMNFVNIIKLNIYRSQVWNAIINTMRKHDIGKNHLNNETLIH